MSAPTLQQRQTIRQQARDLKDARAVSTFCGGCNARQPVTNLFRCYECGVYFCANCGSEHWPDAARRKKDYLFYECDPAELPVVSVGAKE